MTFLILNIYLVPHVEYTGGYFFFLLALLLTIPMLSTVIITSILNSVTNVNLHSVTTPLP